MASKKSKILLAPLCLGIALSLGLGMNYLRLKKERAAYEKEIEDLGGRLALYQEKYLEKKALAEQLLRTKLALEGQKRAVLKQLESLQAEKGAASASKIALEEKIREMEAEALSLNEQAKSLSSQIAALKEEKAGLQRAHAQAEEAHKERERRLLAEQEALESQIRKTNRDLERCEEHNATLCIIAEELVEKYKAKGVVKTILQNEPLTQIKKVELEQFVEEYHDRIEAQRVDSQD
jgi:chromosome segregation ATPase